MGDFNMVKTRDAKWHGLGNVITKAEKQAWNQFFKGLDLVDIGEP